MSASGLNEEESIQANGKSITSEAPVSRIYKRRGRTLFVRRGPVIDIDFRVGHRLPITSSRGPALFVRRGLEIDFRMGHRLPVTANRRPVSLASGTGK